MPIDFPLNGIFEQTFQGHPLSDAAWLYYVTGGSRQRANQFLTDLTGINLVGGQLFESDSLESISGIIHLYENLCNTFLFPTSHDLGQLVSFLFATSAWMSDIDDGPLHNLSGSERKIFPWFTDEGSMEKGVWMDGLFKEVKRQFRTLTEARNITRFENIQEAFEFWDTQVIKVKGNFPRKYDSSTVGNLMGFGVLVSDKSQGYSKEAIIPLLFDKISEVVTWMYKNNKFPQLLQEFDKKFAQGATLDISGFLRLESKPNERLNMPKDRLTECRFYEQADLFARAKSGGVSEKYFKTFLKTFAMAGHDFAQTMRPVLQRYQKARGDDLDAKLEPFMENLTDRIFNRVQFEPDAVMDRPNLNYILKLLSGKTQTQQSAQQVPTKSTTEITTTTTTETGNILYWFGGAVLAAFVFLRR